MEGVFKSIGADGYKKTGIINVGADGIEVSHSNINAKTKMAADGFKIYDSAGNLIGGVYIPITGQSVRLVASTMLDPAKPEYCAQFSKYDGDHGLSDVYGFELKRSSDGEILVGLTANADGTDGYISSKSNAVSINEMSRACANIHQIVVSTSTPNINNYSDGTLWLKPVGE